MFDTITSSLVEQRCADYFRQNELIVKKETDENFNAQMQKLMLRKIALQEKKEMKPVDDGWARFADKIFSRVTLIFVIISAISLIGGILTKQFWTGFMIGTYSFIWVLINIGIFLWARAQRAFSESMFIQEEASLKRDMVEFIFKFGASRDPADILNLNNKKHLSLK